MSQIWTHTFLNLEQCPVNIFNQPFIKREFLSKFTRYIRLQDVISNS